MNCCNSWYCSCTPKGRGSCWVEVDVCKFMTIIKRIITNGGYAIGYCYTCEAGAIIKRRITNGSNAVRDCYICEVEALKECKIINGGYAT